MKNIFISGDGKQYSHVLAIDKKLKGLGLIMSIDNPIIYREYFLLEIKFIFLTFWIKIYFKK